jgi:tetratricopeptide (TPR) repeat protein
MLMTMMLFFCFSQQGCDKQNEWLDVKSNKSAVVPASLKDFQAMLDLTPLINDQYSTAGLAGSDNYSVNDVAFNASTEEYRNLYTWNKKIWPGPYAGHWEAPYKIIEIANIVLEGSQKINLDSYEFKNVKGQALFHRAIAYYNLVQLFCTEFTPAAITDPGLPVRESSDVNIILQRSTLIHTYQQIIKDAEQSSQLLPNVQPYVQRPLRAAAFALLAKTYLHMGAYENALIAANNCLELKPQLLDFNDNSIIDLNSSYKFPAYAAQNPEVLFYAESYQYKSVSAVPSSPGIVSDEVYQSYAPSDLRKTILYTLSGTTPKFRGSYTGSHANFCGLGTNEIYLVRAECYARTGNPGAAMADLNHLLKKRYEAGTHSDQSAINADDALNKVLYERRKELPFTGNIRWEDLKRLNKEIRFQKTVTRTVDGVLYTLAPNDRRYVLPISDREIQLSGIVQNER